MLQYIEIPSLDLTVRKAILDGVVNKLLQDSGVTEAEIIYDDEDMDTRHQPNSEVGVESGISFGATNYVAVQFEEERQDKNRVCRGIGLNQQVPVFKNREYDIIVEPIMTQYDVNITITRFAQSKDKLNRWINRLESLQDMGRQTLVTSVEAHYIFPDAAIYVLGECWRAINTNLTAENKGTFKEFMRKHLNRSVSVVTDVGGGNAHLAVRHALTRLELIYDTKPIVKEKAASTYKAEVTFSFTYARPEELVVSYPIILNQTLVSEKLLPIFAPTYWNNEVDIVVSDAQACDDAVASWQNMRLPYFLTSDDTAAKLVDPEKHNKLEIVGTDLVFGVKEDGELELKAFDKADLPFDFSPAMTEYIDECYAKDPSTESCIVRYDTYRNNTIVPKSKMEFKDGAFYCKEQPKLSDNLYVKQVMVVNLDVMKYDDVLQLRKHPAAIKELVDFVNPNNKFPEHLFTGSIVPWKDFDNVVNSMRKSINEFSRAGMMTTMLNSKIVIYTGE